MKLNRMSLCRWSTVAAFIMLNQSCGSSVSNKNIPKPVDELTTDDIEDETVLARQAKWEEMATALGIGNNKVTTSEELLTQLATPSTYLSSNAAALPALMTTLTGQYTANGKANQSRCAAVDSVTFWKNAYNATGTAVAAKVYLMKYKLQTDSDGTAEENVRSGLFVVPNSGVQDARLIAYGHGGDSGLSYNEIAANFGDLQASNVIVAPAFPSEAVCNGNTGENKTCDSEGNLADGVGTAVPYDNDADDLLGIYDCVFRAYAGNNASPYDLSDATDYRTRIKPYGAGAVSAAPHAVLAGASRGGLVSLVAAGRMGAHLAAGAGSGALGSAYGSPSFFGCSVNFAGPVGPTVGKARIYFELLVKGTIENSAFINLPGIRKLKDLFNDYIAGEVTAEVAKMRAVQRDVTLTSPLIAAALQNWSSYSGSTQNALSRQTRGRMLWLHGDADTVVPVTDTQLQYNVLAGMTATQIGYITGGGSSTMPGVNVTARVFPGAGHFDAAYYTASGTYPDNYVASDAITGANALLGDNGFLNTASQLDSTVAETLASWMSDTSFGCSYPSE